MHTSPEGGSGDFFPTVHNWPRIKSATPILLGLPAVKVSTIHTITVDDREKTPNFGKPRFNPTSVLAVPDTSVVGLRLYTKENGAERALGEVYAKTLPKGVDEKARRRARQVHRGLEAEALRGDPGGRRSSR